MHLSNRLNRPFAGPGHMVQNFIYWWASCTVGLPKQRHVHCFFSHCATCLPVYVILHQVAGSCKGPICHWEGNWTQSQHSLNQNKLFIYSAILHFWEEVSSDLLSRGHHGEKEIKRNIFRKRNRPHKSVSLTICIKNSVAIIRGFITFLYRRSVGFFSQAFLVFLMKDSKKRRQKQPGKLMAKPRSQLVNLPGAWPLMNPLIW